MKWINVKDELPEDGGRYWCYVEVQTSLGNSNYQWNLYYSEHVKKFNNDNGVVTHWMPLPKPPTKQGI